MLSLCVAYIQWLIFLYIFNRSNKRKTNGGLSMVAKGRLKRSIEGLRRHHVKLTEGDAFSQFHVMLSFQ